MRFITFIFSVFIIVTSCSIQAKAQSPSEAFQGILDKDFKLIQRSSVKTIGPVLEEIQNTQFEGTSDFLMKWQNKELWFRRNNNQFFYVTTEDKKTYQLLNIITGEAEATALSNEIRQVKPNSGVRSLLAANLVQFQLTDPDLETRRASVLSLQRNPKPEHLPALRSALEKETDPDLKSELALLERLLTMQFDKDEKARVEAIQSFDGDLRLEVRARLNPLLNTSLSFAKEVPENTNLARIIIPGETTYNPDASAKRLNSLSWFSDATSEISQEEAYAMLVKSGAAPEDILQDQRKEILIANIKDGKVGSYNVAILNTPEARLGAYKDLVLLGLAKPVPSEAEKQQAIDEHVFYASFNEPSVAVTSAAREILNNINASVKWNEFADLTLDAISLASIYFLAAIGLAITFGVMRVINMAHGEFIMMGAYSGYVVQQVITNYTLSIIVAIPVAFMVTFLAGVLMERTIIRYLYHRPLETLLATFGVSIALQQIAKNIFGTQARPLTSPEWLDGAWVFNDVVSISLIRIAILVLGIMFFLGLLWTLNKTRLGLETRAVTQNPRMAASMGIDPDKINMLTFGLGSGIAGVAGVAIGLYAKVTSEMGGDYIVQSFMTVVVGGVGSIWGTLAGATMIGFLQKFIEYFNPSNTLAAQTYMIIFIIIFIQFRPKGLIALKGRAAEA